MVEHKLVSFASVAALWTLVTLLLKLIRLLLKWKYIQGKKCAIFAAMLRKWSHFVLKVSSRLPGLECSYGKIFIPVTEISVAKLEISITGPPRPLIWTHRNFYEGKSGGARSRKPSQPGRPGSYEEALTVQNTHRRALLFIDNRQFIGFLHEQNWAASTDINFMVTYWALINKRCLQFRRNSNLQLIFFFLLCRRDRLSGGRNSRKRVVRGGKLWSSETLLYPNISN